MKWSLRCLMFGHNYVSSGVIYISGEFFRRYKCIKCGNIKRVRIELNNHKI